MANLVLNGKSIDSIDDIAENFVEEDVLREFRSGSLTSWLEEYGYEEELERVRSIKPTASSIRVLAGISEALNLDDDVIAEAAARREEQRRKEEAVRKAQEERQLEEDNARQNNDREQALNACDKATPQWNDDSLPVNGPVEDSNVDELKDVPKWKGNWASMVRDWEVAFRGYSNGAMNGWHSSMGRLAYCYSYGLGTKRDEDLAFQWAAKGAEYDLIARVVLGDCYFCGFGVKKDVAEGLRWYRLAAELGDESGIERLRRCYEHGDGVPRNPEMAFELSKNAAEHGSVACQMDVGRRYLCGDGVAKNCEIAVNWLRKAARQGYPWAQLRLAICYATGLGTCKNVERGRGWANKAAEFGLDVTVFDMAVGVANIETKRNLRIGDTAFEASLCKNCSICADQCPVGVITVKACKAKNDKCSLCFNCEDVCPVGAIDGFDIDPAMCINCGSCMSACPEGAIYTAMRCVIDPNVCSQCGICVVACPDDHIVVDNK